MGRTMSVTTRASSTQPPAPRPDAVHNNPALSAARATHKTPVPAPPPPPKRLTKNGFVSSGALAAAARAGKGAALSQGNTVGLYGNGALRKHSVDSSVVGSRNNSATNLSPFPESGSSDHNHLPDPPSFRQASPSHIAAVRAAERSTTPGTSGLPRYKESPPRQDPSPERKDERPIPATNTLVELFEARAKAGSDQVKPLTATGPSVVLSPKPVRAASIKSITSRAEQVASQPAKAPAEPPSRRLSKAPERSEVSARPQSAAHLRESVAKSPAPPLSRSPSRNNIQTQRESQVLGHHGSVKKSSPPSLRPRPRSISLDRTIPAEKSKPYATPLGSPSTRPHLRPSPSDRSLTTQMAVPNGGLREISRPRSSFNPSKVQPQLNVNALANAIVASSLASSRAPSPRVAPPPDPYKFPPQPPPPRRSGKTAGMSFLVSHHTGPPKMPPRPPSPNKTTLKQTLRKQPTGPEYEEKRERPATHDGRGRGKLRKHVGISRPNTLDRIDPTDRKLYEGVWAANRGVLTTQEELHPIPPPPVGQRPKAADEVHGLVVKDIWKRSGLDDPLLEQIWNLVDGAEGVKRSSYGKLDRVEFCVGMWLVDQALMGRKLPRKLPESVWESMRVGPALIFRR